MGACQRQINAKGLQTATKEQLSGGLQSLGVDLPLAGPHTTRQSF